MKYYEADSITPEQKRELCLIIASTPKSELALHEWILSDLKTRLDYISPNDRKYFQETHPNTLINSHEVRVHDLWVILALTHQKIPVSKEFITMLNEFALSLDIIYEKKNES